jgi:hypothetical protein
MSVDRWEDWLAGLADAATRLEQQLADGELLSFPDLTPPPLSPDSPGLPGELLPRAARLLDRLERLERIAQTQCDSVVARLRRLPVPRRPTAAVPNYDLGGAIDIAG